MTVGEKGQEIWPSNVWPSSMYFQLMVIEPPRSREAIGTFGRFPGGPVNFQMYFGPLWLEKKTLTIILSSPKVDILHSSDM